jgi:asparagine synthase (glutamine-hydrolysing)
MCGIFGLATPGRAVKMASAFRGIQALSHRGPDGLGVAVGSLGDSTLAFHLNPEYPGLEADPSTLLRAGGDVFLGHRRLSIIDLSTSAYQPMTGEDGSVWVVFNGEIYNHAELRRDLQQRGHRFRTDHSDTEVLVHGYEEWGDSLVDRLNGMFGLAILDLRRRHLFLARDPFGEKPLYYVLTSQAVAFASELQALTQSGVAGDEVSETGLAEFVRFGYVPAPSSILRGVSKLQNAEMVRIDLDRMREVGRRRYWMPSYDPAPVTNPAAWDEEFREVLDRAVRARFMSDVPLGAYLSGGLDSSTIVDRLRAAGPCLTFNISFPESTVDEGPFAAAVAAKYGTRHRSQPITPGDLIAALPDFQKVFDEPFGDPSALPTFALARMTREHVTVALSGDGGDELLGGYTRYALQRRLSRLLDGWPTRAPAALARTIADRWPQRLKGRGIADLVDGDPRVRYERAMSDTWLLAQSHVARAAAYRFDEVWDEDGPSLLRQMCRADLLLYLPEDLMTKVDRTAMAFGLEVRAPLLDKELFDFVGRAPDEVLGFGQNNKQPFRRLLEPRIGAALVNRPKQGFSLPLGRWFRRDLRDLAHDALTGSGAYVGTVFPAACVAGLLREHVSGTRNHGSRLWRLLALELWHRNYVRPAVAAGPAATAS